MRFGKKLLLVSIATASISFVVTTILLNMTTGMGPAQSTGASYSQITGVRANRGNSLSLSTMSSALMIDRAELASQIQNAFQTSEGIAKAKATHKPGLIIYGPYWSLAPGHYRGGMEIAYGPFVPDEGFLCRLDVASGANILGALDIDAKLAKRHRLFDLPFTIKSGVAYDPIELRLWCAGLADLTVESAFFLRR
jgi:hypothetical protein